MIKVSCSTKILTLSLSKPGMSNLRLRYSPFSFAPHPFLSPNSPPPDSAML
ncbi:hypothetical protein HanIR_Chr13g0658581 [Helianthus annuus]|nr:hypothetical protein HanIR_Chr13g0658581 [Helianthus annuus]